MNYTAMFSNVSSWLSSSAGKGACLLGLTFTLSVPVSAAIAPMDSIGVEVSNGTIIVIHKVEPKETLFSISRRYGAAVADIKSANPGIENGLMIGQVIKVPTQRRATTQAPGTSAAQGPATATNGGVKTHTVAPQQTLYAIATMHKVTVEELRAWNKLSGNEISIGQQLIVSAPGGQKIETAPVTHRVITTTAEEPAKVVYPPNGIHKVGPSQTLYSIATMYNLSVDELKKMNNIQVDDLSVGQELAVTPAAARTLQAQAPQEVVPVNHYPAPAQTSSTGTGSAQPENTSSTVNITGYDKVVETGLAEVIDSPVETSKYMALHKTAPIGTILTIKNDMNGTSVFVRVIGRLPETGINDKVVVRISKKAFERLNPVDKRFPVEVSYIP